MYIFYKFKERIYLILSIKQYVLPDPAVAIKLVD